jgi:hypothetical protein
MKVYNCVVLYFFINGLFNDAVNGSNHIQFNYIALSEKLENIWKAMVMA